MLGKQSTEPFLKFLTKDFPPLKDGERIRTINNGYISLKNVDNEHCEFTYFYGIKEKYRILDEYRHLYELSESVLNENGAFTKYYIKK